MFRELAEYLERYWRWILRSFFFFYLTLVMRLGNWPRWQKVWPRWVRQTSACVLLTTCTSYWLLVPSLSLPFNRQMRHRRNPHHPRLCKRTHPILTSWQFHPMSRKITRWISRRWRNERGWRWEEIKEGNVERWRWRIGEGLWLCYAWESECVRAGRAIESHDLAIFVEP